MKRLALAVTLLSLSFSVFSGAVFHPMGESLTYGETAHHQSLIEYTNNPAVGASSLGVMGWNMGFGGLTSFGLGLEVGPVDDLTNNVDALSEQLNAFSDDAPPSIQQVTDIKKNFDQFLIDAGESGYFQLHSAASMPFFPIVWSSYNTLGGSLVLDASAAFQAKLRILDRPIVFNPLEQGANQLETNTAAYVKFGAIAEISVGYSRPLLETSFGVFFGGVRAKYYQAGLRKTLIGISQLEDSTQTVEDELTRDADLQSGVGLDLGLMWTGENFRIGATFKNINSPTFKYDAIGLGCSSLDDGVLKDSCFIAASFANEVDLEETYVMDAQVTLAASLYSVSRNWVMSVAADTSPVNDPVANQLQWLTTSAAYATRSWIIPGVRIGYRKNLAGSQLDAVTAGVTLFKTLHVDGAYGLEQIDIDGASAPRMLQVNIGVDFLF